MSDCERCPCRDAGRAYFIERWKGRRSIEFNDWWKNISDLADAAKVPDESDKFGQLSAAGRALQKYGGRTDSAFPTAKGNPAAINEQGSKLLIAS
ncbi:hypothetical protein KGP93_13145 [Burkholderia multivorans]|nr:hypothetical protein [Burkholderia multivorans]